MATIINTPPSGSPENSGNVLGNLVAVLTLLILGVLFFVYGLPALRSAAGGGTNVNVPDQIDVNLNTPGNSGNPGSPNQP